MNLPNKLTLIRIVCIPFFIVFAVYDFFPFDDCYADWLSRAIAAFLFIGASVTDFLDGHIARKHNLITDFGKFMDPLADKFLVLGSMFALCMSSFTFEYNTVMEHSYCLSPETLRHFFFWGAIVVLFRELAVTSMRLVVAKSGVVVAANMLGKIKTNTQIVCISVLLLEPIVLPFCRGWLSLASIVCMTVFTLWSGLNYILSYWKYLDTAK